MSVIGNIQFYPPSSGIRPVMTNFGGDVFIFNDRDTPQVMYKHKTSGAFHVGAPGPSGSVLFPVAGGDTGNALFSYLWRFRWKIDANGYVTNPSSGFSFETTATDCSIAFSMYPEPTSGSQKYDRVIIEMTRPGGAEFYVYAESGMPSSATTWQMPVMGQTQGTLRTFDAFGHSPAPSGGGRVVHAHKGRLWTCHLVDEAMGTAYCPANSVIVSGTNTRWGDYAVGRLFSFANSGVTRTIVEATSTSGIQLDSGYGTSLASGDYVIFPKDPHIVRYSLISLPESWNTEGNYERVMTNSNDKPVGMATYFDTLLIMGTHTVIGWTYDLEPRLGKIETISTTRGALNHECIVQANNAVYALDYQGIYRFSSAQMDHISRPIDEILFGRRTGWDGIDWTQGHLFHGVHNEQRKEIIWWVTLNRDGESNTLNRALVYRYEDDVWTIFEFVNKVMASTLLPDDDFNYVPVVSTSGANMWFFGKNNTDGAPSNSAVSGLVAAGSTTTLVYWDGGTLETANLGLQGCVAVIAGCGSGIIDSNTSASLTLQSALPSTPAVGSGIRIAPIESKLQTSQRALDYHASYNTGKNLTIRYIPTADTYHLRVRFFFDYSDTPTIIDAASGRTYTDIDVSTTGGLLQIPIPKKDFRVVSIEITNTEPRNTFQITEMYADGETGEDEVPF